MIALSNTSDKAMRAQVAESVSIIAGVDFPDKWPDLVDVSTFQLGCGCPRTSPEGREGQNTSHAIARRNSFRRCHQQITTSTLACSRRHTRYSVHGELPRAQTHSSQRSTTCSPASRSPSLNSCFTPPPCSSLLPLLPTWRPSHKPKSRL